ncbi:charged multivesicular body protein 6 [Trypanosoma grayi]|uniref:charged multivesicular body protein 6 n=1 Tax=Trypanosoma grayi TaxID=71804 RepID=UPI0004F42533|nr:charged multivesicular body protein 6 [Trypanosoma grayi]KEG10808.1 charged multivesicular body protein 6 [Trypanosoma grayi]
MGSHGSKNSSQPNAPRVVITSSDRAKLELKLQRDKLTVAMRRCESTAKEERIKAAEFLRSGNRRKALYCLRREQFQRTQLANVTDMLDNIQKLLDTVEFSQIEVEVFDALKSGKEELSRLNSMLNVDDIAELMNDTAETVEEARRINEVLARPLDGFDDESLLEELMSHENMEVDKIGTDLNELSIPNHKLPERVKPEERVSGDGPRESMLPA